MQFRQRRRFVVDGAVQWTAVAYVLGIVLVALAVHAFLTYGRLADRVRPDAGAISLPVALLVDLGVSLALTSVFAVVAVIFGSHKVVGPVYRCAQAMRLLQRGDLTQPVKLRRGDFLVPFANEVNRAITSLHNVAVEDRVLLDEAVRQLTLAKGAIASPDAQRSVDRVIEGLGKIGMRLKIDPEAARQAATRPARTPEPPPGAGAVPPLL